jgi:hypothetical protein
MRKLAIILTTMLLTITSAWAQKDSLLSDYDYYFQQMELIHPDPYSAFGGKEGFKKAVGELRNNLAARDSISLNDMQVEITKLLSALHDGHTNVGYPEAPHIEENAWTPLNLKVIQDGIIVNGYMPEYEFLKGARLQEIESEPLNSVLQRFDKITITENHYGLMGKACNALCHNNSIRELFPNFNTHTLSMKFTLTNGNDTIVNLPFYPNGPKWKTFISPATDKRFPRNNFEYRFIDNKKTTMVMCIKEIYSADVPDSKDSTIIVAQAFAQMLKEMKKKKSRRLIIDLRGNSGGWTPIMYAALYELYGNHFLKTNLGFHFTTKISEPLLKRDGITLEQFNNINGTSLKMGEYFEEPSNISNIKDFMCADKSILEAQHGKPIYTPKEIYVVTDERTFSAAFHFAYMMHKMGATIVGVTSGQAPNTFMELTPFKLPYSGLECSVSNSLQICFPKNHPMTKEFTPDIQLSYDNYRQFNFSADAELLFIEKLKK